MLMKHASDPSHAFGANQTNKKVYNTRAKANSSQMMVHVGRQDSSFAQMFAEGMRDFSIPQFGTKRANEKFSLGSPTLLNGRYVVYKVMGEDKKGTFEGNRRYNEFHLLRQVIRANWPGVYIPSLPAKKVLGNKDVRFIIERRYFIEKFYLQLSKIEPIVNGNEFQCFIRPPVK